MALLSNSLFQDSISQKSFSLPHNFGPYCTLCYTIISSATHSLRVQITWKKRAKMAATMCTAASTTVFGLATSPLSSTSSRVSSPSKISLTSDFLRPSVAPRNPFRLPKASYGKFTCFERDWLRTDLNVIGFGLIGWVAPSSIPAINGKSLTGLFLESIGTELSHWPTGPALTSDFWLWMISWHLGLFLCLTFGQIGFKGRTEDYF